MDTQTVEWTNKEASPLKSLDEVQRGYEYIVIYIEKAIYREKYSEILLL